MLQAVENDFNAAASPASFRLASSPSHAVFTSRGVGSAQTRAMTAWPVCVWVPHPAATEPPRSRLTLFTQRVAIAIISCGFMILIRLYTLSAIARDSEDYYKAYVFDRFLPLCISPYYFRRRSSDIVETCPHGLSPTSVDYMLFWFS